MATGSTHFLRAESDLAAVTSTMNAHADLLLNPFAIAFGWCCPFSRFQGYTILGEEEASLFFLNCVALGGSHGKSCIGGLAARFSVPNGLRNCGRN